MGSMWFFIAKQTGKKIGKWAKGSKKKKKETNDEEVSEEKLKQYDNIKDLLKDLFDIGY